jgi:hypothetical protein
MPHLAFNQSVVCRVSGEKMWSCEKWKEKKRLEKNIKLKALKANKNKNVSW